MASHCGYFRVSSHKFLLRVLWRRVPVRGLQTPCPLLNAGSCSKPSAQGIRLCLGLNCVYFCTCMCNHIHIHMHAHSGKLTTGVLIGVSLTMQGHESGTSQALTLHHLKDLAMFIQDEFPSHTCSPYEKPPHYDATSKKVCMQKICDRTFMYAN